MERVLILGATSAIADEIAQLHAQRGDRLYLVGRSPEKLAAVAARCPGAMTRRADFADLDSNEGVIADAWEALGGIDVAVIAHGDLGDQLASERSFKEAELVLRTNLLSVIAQLIPLANRMEEAGKGRIGVITSVAGERGRPRNYTYGTAKGALNVYLQGLRSRLYTTGIGITTIKLGPVDTPMTKDHAKNMLFGKPAAVAKSIVAAIDAAIPEAWVPGIWGAIMPVVKNTPEMVFQKLSFLSGR